MKITVDLPSDLAQALLHLDCGDNSCLFRDPNGPGRVGTNGGCRCFRALSPSSKAMTVERTLSRVVRELRREPSLRDFLAGR